MKFYFLHASFDPLLSSAVIKITCCTLSAPITWTVWLFLPFKTILHKVTFLLYEVFSSIFFNPSQHGISSHSFSNWVKHPAELRLICYLQPTLGDGHSQQTLFLQQNVGICTWSGSNSDYIKNFTLDQLLPPKELWKKNKKTKQNCWFSELSEFWSADMNWLNPSLFRLSSGFFSLITEFHSQNICCLLIRLWVGAWA